MVNTALLLHGERCAEPRVARIFNILCEKPITSAAWLAPRVRQLVGVDGQQRVAFLTASGAAWRFLKSPFSRNAFFDEKTGEPAADAFQEFSDEEMET